MNRRTSIGRLVILIIAAIAVVCVAAIYILAPKGIESFELVLDDGSPIGNELTLYEGADLVTSYVIEPKGFANREITYLVADDSVITVSNDGIIHADSVGETLLTAQVADIRQDVSVKVTQGVKDIKGLEKEITLAEGETKQLEPKVKMYEKGIVEPELSFKSKDKNVVTVDEDGLITATGEGSTTIKVEAGSVTKKVKVVVEKGATVIQPTTQVSITAPRLSTTSKAATNRVVTKATKANTKNTVKKPGKKGNDNQADSGGDDTPKDNGGNDTPKDNGGNDTPKDSGGEDSSPDSGDE